MSIIDDFGYDGYDDADVKALVTHAMELKAMLKKHEFYTGKGYECPECHQHATWKGTTTPHKPGCKLAELLEK